MVTAAQPAVLEKSFTLFCLDDGQRTQQIIEQVAAGDCPVQIVGEAGTGKLNIAQRIHATGNGHGTAFTALDCLEVSAGRLRAALCDPGTVYLRNIDKLAPEMQNVLLNHSGRNARVIGGSRRHLGDSVKTGAVSEDFYYSIGGVTLQTVPLRHRHSDVLEIADQMLRRICAEMGKPVPVLDLEFESLLLSHSWPGNLSELESAMKTFVLIGDPDFALGALRSSMSRVRSMKPGVSLKEVSRVASMQAEQALISEVLQATGGNRKQAARELKISYKALLYKLKKIGGDRTPGLPNGGL